MEQEVDLLVAVEILDASHAGLDLSHVFHAVRVTAGRVIQAAIEQLFRRLLGSLAVFADECRRVQERRGAPLRIAIAPAAEPRR